MGRAHPVELIFTTYLIKDSVFKYNPITRAHKYNVVKWIQKFEYYN